MNTRTLGLRFEVAVRICADLLIVNTGTIAGLIVYYLAFSPSRQLADLLRNYFTSFWFLSLIAISVFTAMGFYSRGRAYASRYKALVVLQAATLAYLIFGFAGFVLPFVSRLPRPALLFSWAIVSFGLITARVWATIWDQVKASESFSQAPAVVSGIPGSRGTVLLIGGAGYIGSSLLTRLLRDGYKVRLLDSFLYGGEAIRQWRSHPNLDVIESDFRRVDVVVRAMRGVNQVIHLGAIVGDPACALDEELTTEINLLATRMIAEVTMGQGIKRFIFASTCSVYGASDLLMDERSNLNPVSLYARTKIACENVLLSMKSSTFSPVILRFGTIYGLSGRTRFDLVVNLLAAKAIVDGVITIFGSDQWRPFLHVNDAALAVYLACRAPEQALVPTIFNVGSDAQNYTLGDVGRIIKEMVPAGELQIFDKDGDRRNYRVNFDRIRKSLRFEPEWTLEKGIQQVITAIRSGQVTDYKDSRYSNVRFLSEEIGLESLRSAQQRWIEEALRPEVRVELAAGA